ncbi:g10642 [Coccomyxa viridis]|uniref:Ribokinase n=1 Tax=Coccomyxa viridis TaxID=1274662 RepID=A0ABP1G695_9CHLO
MSFPTGEPGLSRRGRRGARRLLVTAEKHEAKPLVVVGSVNADLVLEIDRLPADGETLGAKSLNTFPGGKGANQAAAAAKLQHPTYMLGQVGSDANAELLKSSLSEAGVKLDHLREVDGPSGTAVILVQPSGENSIMIVGGANTADWEFDESALQLLRTAGMVLLQREIPEEVNARVAAIAKGAHVPVLLDCGGVEGPISPELMHNITTLSPNETELARLTGMETESEDQAEEAARKILSQGIHSVLVKRGTNGSLLIDRDGDVNLQPIFEVEKVVDTTGAGDCFTGAYAVAILEGKKPEEALTFAAAASALCVGRSGAMPSLPRREEVDRKLSSR